MPDDDEAKWVSMSAAARALGVSRQAIRGRIGRGTLETRLEMVGNRERLRVRLPEEIREPIPEWLRDRFRGREPQRSVADSGPDPRDVELVELRVRVAEMAATMAAQREHIADLRAELARRRWPGLRRWWRRVWEGEG